MSAEIILGEELPGAPDCLQSGIRTHGWLQLRHDRGPYRGFQVLGSSSQQFRHEVEDDQDARLGMGEEEVKVDEVDEEDDVVEEQGPNIG